MTQFPNTGSTGETKDEWIHARVAHLVADSHTQIEILDSIMETPGDTRSAMMGAFEVVAEDPPKSPAHDRAITVIARLIVQRATELATLEWDRMARSIEPELCAAAAA